MEQAHKRYRDRYGEMVGKNRNRRSNIRLASTGEYTKLSQRPNIQMKAFLSIVTVCVFTFSTLAGVAFHIVADLREQQGMAVNLVHMPLRDLAKFNI